MKKLILSVLALLGMATMATKADAQFYVYDKDGKVLYKMEEGTPAYIEFEAPVNAITGTTNGHDWVDMGLSVKWGTMNVGANAPQEYGSYIAWGETDPAAKSSYDWSTYKFQAEFIGDNKTIIDKADDVAAANYGGDWVIPTKDDWEEIYNNCTHKWTTQNGVNGFLITATNGNSIFLPAAGYRSESGLNDAGSSGYYLSSTLDESESYYVVCLSFNSSNFYTGSKRLRYYGQSVRPICPAKGNTNGHAYVDLDLPSGKLWATCNVDASALEENGDYFAWGETFAKSNYSWSTYKHMLEGKSDWYFVNKYQVSDGQYGGIWYNFSKYSYSDNKTTLESTDDAATANWGIEWRMPTAAEWKELYNNTTQIWTDDYEGTGVRGYIFTSTKKGHEGCFIFLPAAGYRDYGLEGSYGVYWSSTLGDYSSYLGKSLSFQSYKVYTSNYSNRYYGQSIRPVCPGE